MASFIKYVGADGDNWLIQEVTDGVSGDVTSTSDKGSIWNAIENGSTDYRGFPGNPKNQKPNETINEGPVTQESNSTDRVAFDYRLAKPRFGKGGKIVNYAVAMDPNEKQATQEGMFAKDKTRIDPADDLTEGVPSINNWYAYTTLSGMGKDKELLFDIKDKRRWYESDELIINKKNLDSYNSASLKNVSKEPTTQKLIEYGALDEKQRTPYYYSDFAYCKYWRKIPNNRLITLRRYAVPTYASLEFPDFGPSDQTNTSKPEPGNNKFAPIAQAVTWAAPETDNALSKLMSFGVKLNWTDIESQVHESTEQNTGADALDGLLGGFAKTLSVASGERGSDNYLYGGDTPPDPYKDGPYANRIMGPVNSINKTKARAQGMESSQDITLNFHYSARSIGGINTKAAMLDIMANFLVLTYGTGTFWGGANRFRGQVQSFPWKKGMAAWYSGDPVAFGQAVKSTMSTAMSNISKLFDDAMNNPKEALMKIAKGAMMMGIKKSKPQQFHGLRSILTGEPVGEWHLVLGNPFNPTMMIGNLVCTDCSFAFNDELGPDDFPTEMTITVKLEHGMSLDRTGVEAMFNRGRGRIYTLPTGVENTSAANESTIDKFTGKNNRTAGAVPGEIPGPGGFNNTQYSGQVSENDWDAAVKAGKSWAGSNDESTNLTKRRELGYSESKK